MRAWTWVIVTLIGLTVPSSAFAANEPGLPVRSIHFVLGTQNVNSHAVKQEEAEKLVRIARLNGFNTVVVQLAKGVRWDSAPELARTGAWSKDDFIHFADSLEPIGLILVPEIKFLSHQEKFLVNSHPDLMFNRATYDPRKEETYQLVFALLDEIIKAIHPRAIHIGHDEVAGHNERSRKKWLRPGEEMLPAQLFLKDVLRIHSYLKQRGIDTWMWGDMLISPDEFPAMLARHLHGTVAGYGKPLRDQLPRDIVICDWHYFGRQHEFPSLATIQKEGFRVIGTTWKKEQTIRNFSRYAAKHGAYGMMATTWFHVPRKEWDVVENVIHTSGKIFLRDFPDAE